MDSLQEKYKFNIMALYAESMIMMNMTRNICTTSLEEENKIKHRT